jgi:hypothetical protein
MQGKEVIPTDVDIKIHGLIIQGSGRNNGALGDK